MNQMQVKKEAANIQSVKLDYPIRIHTANGEKLLESLPVRRLTVGDLRAVAGLKTDAEQELAMMTRITGLVPGKNCQSRQFLKILPERYANAQIFQKLRHRNFGGLPPNLSRRRERLIYQK